jgi:hypothetical protein
MNEHTAAHVAQGDLFETKAVRSLLDQLLADSRLYVESQSYKDLLDFVVRLRNFAPFNAMLLQVQKPGLSYAASARDWRERFGRAPKEGARPLLILWPFGPVALVYDVLDTEGEPLPKDVASFFALGSDRRGQIEVFRANGTQEEHRMELGGCRRSQGGLDLRGQACIQCQTGNPVPNPHQSQPSASRAIRNARA